MMSRLLMRMPNIVTNRPWNSIVRPGVAASMSSQSKDRDRPKYKAVIFDMGGVLLPSPFEMFRGKSCFTSSFLSIFYAQAHVGIYI